MLIGLNEELYSDEISELKSEIDSLRSYIEKNRAKVTIDVSPAMKDIERLVRVYDAAMNYISGATGIKRYNTEQISSGLNATASRLFGGQSNAFGGIASSSAPSLVGEEKPEILVRPSTGEWRLIGKHGAEFFDVRRGDIIFNGDQTEELLTKGHISTRGKSFAKGYLPPLPKKPNTSNTPSYIVDTATGNNVKQPTSTVKQPSNNTSTSTKDLAKAVEQGVDNSNLGQAAGAIMGGTANAVISGGTSQNPLDLLKWLEDAARGAGGGSGGGGGYSGGSGSSVSDEFKELLDEIQILISRLDTYISNLSAIEEQYQTYRNKNAVIEEIIKKTLQEQSVAQRGADRYLLEANKVNLSDYWKQRVRDGNIDIEEVKDEKLWESIQEYQQWYELYLDMNSKVIELQGNLRELANQKLDNIVSDFEMVISLQDAMVSRQEAFNTLLEAQGKVVDESSYVQMMRDQGEKSNYIQGEINRLTEEFNKLIADGTIQKYTEDWYKWTQQITETTSALYESEAAVIEFKNQIREARWKEFTDGMNGLENEAKELSDILSMISDLNFFNDSGAVTNTGRSALAIYTQQLVNARQTAAEYSKAIDNLEKELANGNITQERYNELVVEYSEAQRSAALNTKAARDAIVNFVKDGINKETEAYRKLIQSKKDDLAATKEYGDYMKQLTDKSQEINAIKAQIQVLQGNDENKAEIRRLNEELQRLNDEYLDMKSDHEYDALMQGYDDALELFEKNQQDEIDALETSLDAQNKAIEDALLLARDNYDEVYAYIGDVADVYGMRLTDNIVSPWENAKNAVDEYRKAVTELTNANIDVDTSKINMPTTDGKDTTAVTESKIDALNPYATTTNSTAGATSSSGSGSSSSGSKSAAVVSGTTGNIKYGDKNNNVKLLQKALNALGYNCGAVDGDFGDKTYAALLAFQRANGLEVDGIVGNQTRAAFKKHGFATGGLIEAAMNHMIKRSGEDGLALVKNKEAILSVDQTKMFRNFVDYLPKLTESNLTRSGDGITIEFDNVVGNIESVSKDTIGDVNRIISQAGEQFMSKLRLEMRKLGVKV